MGKQEGIDLLLQAARHIVDGMGRRDVQFGLVGGGTSLDEMKAYAQELGIADYVTFYGRVPDQEMPDMLNTTAVCVISDVANELNDKSTMNKIMEYMALGTRSQTISWISPKRSSNCSTIRIGGRAWGDFAAAVCWADDNRCSVA